MKKKINILNINSVSLSVSVSMSVYCQFPFPFPYPFPIPLPCPFRFHVRVHLTTALWKYMSDMAIIPLISKARKRWRGNLKGLFTERWWEKSAENLGEPTSLLVVTNAHPPLSLVSQQLPHPLLYPSHPFTHYSSSYVIYIDDINNNPGRLRPGHL
jgi:hypothetical protein